MKSTEHPQEKELLQEIKKGLLNWYNFKKGSTALYIGGEEDAYPSMLSETFLEVTCASNEQLHDTEWQQTHTNRFDYIIAIETLEKHLEPCKCLSSWKEYLKPDGVLLLGMNNRFGLRYFCGDRDPYTDRNFDGIEGYRRAYAKLEDGFEGRCYSRSEIQDMLRTAGWDQVRFYSVFPGLEEPKLIYGEDYLPNEDLGNRLFPSYHYPNAVFLEEECLYEGLIKNHMFHQMANAYLVECPLNGEFSDVLHVTSSMERGKEYALLTIIHRNGIVEKRAPYEEGKKRIHKLLENGESLAEYGISVVNVKWEHDSCVMPYIEAESGQLYLKRMFHTDREKFLTEMDHFRDLILKSSEIVEPDKGDGQGAILKKGYLDMVPLNSFHVNGTFMFYDQEFCVENCPVNEIIWRMIATFYAGDMELGKLLPMNWLLERYGLMERLEQWQKMEWDFLSKLRKEKELRAYHERCRRNGEIVHSNRQRMNYSQEDYERLFVDIFRNADTRKLILFGSGIFTKRFLALYGQDYPVYAIIDNNKEKWGEKLEGIEIHGPQLLHQLRPGEYKVLICIKNYLSVMKQLDRMGVAEYSIFDSHRDYPRKRRPTVSGSISSKKESEIKKKYHVGYIAGVFDLFHVGHLNMFKRAKEQCDYLIVGVVTDEGVRKYKGVEPFVPYEERAELVRSCRYVDEVAEIPLNFGGTRDAWKLHHFDCQFSGSDYVDNADWLAEKEFLEKHGAEMEFFPYTQSTSSSKIKKLIDKKLL